MSRDPSTERQAALQLAGEHELRRLDAAYPGRTFPRTVTEAWPIRESWKGVVTHYRRPLAERLARWIQVAAVLGTFALIGVLLAWRG